MQAASQQPGMVPGQVSTIIPVFNRPTMLHDAVDSVLSQSWKSLQIIISDDGSSDETPVVAAALARAYPGTILLVRGPNGGPGPAREAGRLQATGEFIQYLDSDDRLLPEKFERQIQALRDAPDCDIAYGQTRLIDELGNELASPFKWTGRDIGSLMPGLLVDRWWCTHTPLYRRRLTDAIGPWSAMRWSQDWEYDSRAAALGAKLTSCKALVSEHRHHPGVRQTSGADWQGDPTRLRNRVELLRALWSSAVSVGVGAEAPERQHFARWSFTIARQCAAAGLSSEMNECLNMAEAAAGTSGAGRRGISAFRLASRVMGVGLAGAIARSLARRRTGPGQMTMRQSFIINADGEKS